jgi:hypothetical protein
MPTETPFSAIAGLVPRSRLIGIDPWLRWLAVSALSQKRSKARPRCIYAPADQNAVRLMNAALASNLLDRADEVLLIPAVQITMR